jgi:molybdopterin converting factor small subunit
MPIGVLISTPLRPYAGKLSVIEVTAQTVGEALIDLVVQHPALLKHLSQRGKLRSFVNVCPHSDDIRYLSKDATPVKETDTISIVPSVAGGV